MRHFSHAWPLSMEGAIDYVHLLFAAQSNEIHRVTRDAYCELRVFLGMVHRIQQHFAIQHIYVHVEARCSEERVKNISQVRDTVCHYSTQAFRDQCAGERDAVGCVPIGDFSHRCCRSMDTVCVASMHRIRAWSEGFSTPPPIGRVTCILSVYDV